ncbi:MAG: hypothetical protein AAGJ73_15830 [Pseudomonadota bacterium]
MPDLFRPDGPAAGAAQKTPILRKVIWFAALSIGSGLIVAGVAYLLRALLFI